MFVELTGKPSVSQMEAVAGDPGVRSVHFDTAHGTADLRLEVAADDPHGALRRAAAAFGKLSTLHQLEAGGVLKPVRITVQTAGAYEQTMPILSTAGVATRLGVSAARVRKLATRPDFPNAVEIPGAAGAFYHASAIDEFAAGWDRTAKGGRPRSSVQ